MIPASLLSPPSTFNLTFADLLPLLHVSGTTIGAFTADFSGTVSSSVAASAPGGLAVMGVGLLGLGFLLHRKKDGHQHTDKDMFA